MSLPSISSTRPMGETTSCSRVPRSRSRAIAIAVNMIIVMVRITPTNPGTTNTAVRSSGLYQVVGSIVSGGGRTGSPNARSCMTASSPERAATAPAAASRALATVLVEHDQRDMPDVGVDGVAEQQELHDGRAGDHPQRHPVATQLNELFRC